jgi:glyoxylase-like metal-dependent hydrolase (beta-lactamase superfamily II)
LILIGLLVATAAVAEPEYSALSVDLKPIRISEHCYYVQGRAGVASKANQGFNSNAGFIVTPAGVMVVDTLGSPSLGRALIATIRSVTDLPIRHVILSHYHADHFYGLQAFKEIGADVWAQAAARSYLGSPVAAQRFAQRKVALAPWVNSQTRLIAADHWVDDAETVELGGLHFELRHIGPAHSPEDMIVYVREDQVLYAGDIGFSGRIPFVGTADSRKWLLAIERLMSFKPKVMVVGHGPASNRPGQDLGMTRDYLVYLRTQMGKAATDLMDFDSIYAQTDWSRWQQLPAFDAANRTNAYNVYLQMEQESLSAGLEK